ncbi:small ubiquitin-related modifier 1 [Phtheirospermum japonicum]|uniref:Small ubiquitin-related modifier 1 n=1 Tax=Phtheirospermum japonicum TaxID=374723 RepID=A0A830CQ91_9LAMI|nr:small ubiquitin-related modifier 1 [Phtheirospermum japonicum]
MLDFCDSLDLVYSCARFLFEGNRIRETQTPCDLGMADKDIIDAFYQIDGGGAS